MKSLTITSPRLLSWAFLETFNVPHMRLRWDWVQPMQEAAHTAFEPTQRCYEELREKWEIKLKALGGDPSSLDIEKFRPLRLYREEDWSDWLAWLVETSTTGEFAKILFGGSLNEDLASPKAVKREKLTADGERRTDILVTWKSGNITDVEVKIKDRQLEKTYTTVQKEKAQTHFILITEELESDWNELARKHDGVCKIAVIKWNEVSRALRQCLWRGEELLFWRAWAWTFCGAIEQNILDLSSPNLPRSPMSRFEMALRWLEILSKQEGGTK